MSSFPERLLLLALLLCAAGASAQSRADARYPGIGRAATAQEVAAWDIDVRPDFRGLPAGSGSVAKGQQVWESKCASCHGTFGESNTVFHPLVGGTTAEDVKSGRVAALRQPDYPGRTTLMKLTSLSTLWDYINRAMPWAQPKSLTVEEVYAVTAYMLNLGGIVADNFTLSDRNIGEVQKRLPNRHGATTGHAMWPGHELGGRAQPDVQAVACMKNCPVEAKVASVLPGYARNAHGNLAEQNRGIGPQRGVNTGAAAAPPTAGAAGPNAVQALVQKNHCTACHAAAQPGLGPSWADIARKYEGKADYIAARILAGSSGVWGGASMPPQQLDQAQARQIASWLAAGAKR